MNQTGVAERDLAQRMREGTAMTESEVAAKGLQWVHKQQWVQVWVQV